MPILRVSSLKKTVVVVGEVFWKPFEVRFQDDLRRLQRHQRLILFEINLLGAQASARLLSSSDEYSKIAQLEREEENETRTTISQIAQNVERNRKILEDQQASQKVAEIMLWLSPPPFLETLEACQQTGIPGYGKTTLASSTVEELELELRGNSTERSRDAGVFYFFFRIDHAMESAPDSAYRSILAQFISRHRHDRQLVDKFSFIMDQKSSGGSQRATANVLSDLLRCCTRDTNHYLILDGIDEFTNHMDLIQNLMGITSNCNLKVLLFGRPNVPGLNTRILKACQLPIDRSTISDDIKIFLTAKVENLVEEELLPSNTPVSNYVDHLVRGADGMFLWARLMITYLNSPALTMGQRIKTIKDVILPEGLEKMYDRILDLIARYSRTERDLASWIITWLLHSTQPLTSRQLREALVATHDSTSDPDDHYQDFQDTLSYVCAGLVELGSDTYSNEEHNVGFIHLSVKEHFTHVSQYWDRGSNFQAIILPDSVANMRLATSCLKEVLRATLPTSTSTKPLQLSKALFPKRFLMYAAVNWIKHINRAIYSRYVIRSSTLHKFENEILQTILQLSALLDSPWAISGWLELYYSCPREEIGIGPDFDSLSLRVTLNEWVSQVGSGSALEQALQSLAPELELFVHDMKEIVASWGEKLSSQPTLIWKEVSGFSQSKFLKSSRAMDVTYMEPRRLESEKCSQKYLCRISASTPDGEMTGVLSIWTAESFEKEWQRGKLNHTRSSVIELCDHWSARYQVWNTDEMFLIAEIKIPLNRDEIALQMKQSFRQEDVNKWETSFPMSIKRDCHAFMVLRMLYVLQPATKNSAASCRSATLPLDLSSRLQSYWSDDLKSFDGTQSYGCYDWYTYTTSFSPNGRFIVFSDRNRSPLTNACGVHVGMFAISDARGQIAIDEVGMRRLKTLLAMKIDHLLFHLDNERVIIRFGGNIVVWNFQHGKIQRRIDRRQSLTYLNTAGSELEVLREESLDDLVWTGNKTDMTISSCGRFVVLMPKDTGNPIIVPLPFTENDTSPASNTLTLTSTNAQHTEEVANVEIPNFGLSALGLVPGQVLKGTEAHLDTSGQISRIFSTQSNGSVTITLSSDSTRQPQTQAMELVSLPKWQGIDRSIPLVKVPSPHDASIRIILNTTAEEAYRMAGSQKKALPLVIETDVTGIRYVVSSDVARKQSSLLTPKPNPLYSHSLERHKLESVKFLPEHLYARQDPEECPCRVGRWTCHKHQGEQLELRANTLLTYLIRIIGSLRWP
ncbi:MAG: hypothetical protein M1820_001239 [Bogoriella megaspora]|nr:MAG: hypothetical protein M1820_001239 [Bogoriella megaspora]